MILATHGIVGSQITQFVGLLDLYPSAAAAYSLRRLTGGYTGSAIRVRRTDLAESDIGFTSTGALDTTALLAFTGTGVLDNGFITTWYDQSGNSRNATQSTAIKQPRIVSSGSIILENGKPSINFIGANLCRLDSSANWNYTTTFTVTRFYTRPGFAYIYTSYNTVGKLISDVNGSGYRVYANNSLYANQNPSLTNQDLIYGLFNGVSSQIKVDNNSVVTGDSGSFTASGITIGIAGNNTNDSAFNGTMQELIFYPSNQSSNRTGIETNINSFYSIY
jgi:hypothetical protein